MQTSIQCFLLLSSDFLQAFILFTKQNANHHEFLAGDKDTERMKKQSSKTGTVHKSNLVRSVFFFFGFTPEIAQRLCRVIWDLERGHYMDMRCFSHSWQRKMGRRQPEALLLPCLYSFPMWTEWGSLLGEYVTCPVELLLLDFPRIAWVSLKRNVLFVCF